MTKSWKCFSSSSVCSHNIWMNETMKCIGFYLLNTRSKSVYYLQIALGLNFWTNTADRFSFQWARLLCERKITFSMGYFNSHLCNRREMQMTALRNNIISLWVYWKNFSKSLMWPRLTLTMEEWNSSASRDAADGRYGRVTVSF